MKIYLTTLLLLGLFIFSSAEIKAQQTTPPSRVNVKFNAKYPKFADKASWQQTSDGYTATFNDKGRQTVSRYTEEGSWLGTTTKIQKKDWEPTMRQYMEQSHPGYKYLQGYRYEDADGRRYQIDVEDKSGGRYRIDFDQSGSFINEGPIEGN
ncbi:hypothetical protein D770_12355 [Flammeovirgaceae bacterium 311]|nr:hypothetical protein D770_12355 [Flammeovirgaceae bacterium 311]